MTRREAKFEKALDSTRGGGLATEMVKPDLLKAQGHALAMEIDEAGFARSEFELTGRSWDYYVERSGRGAYTTDSAPTLVHKATGFYFMFVEVPEEVRSRLNDGAPFRAQWSPATDVRVKTEGGLYWDGIILLVGRWLVALRLETAGPDVWAQLAGEAPELVERAGEAFSAGELLRVDRGLDEFLAHARETYELTAEMTARIEGDVKYLKEAARRMPRLDWRNAALGTALGWLLTGVLSPDTVGGLVQHLNQVIHAIMAAAPLLKP